MVQPIDQAEVPRLLFIVDRLGALDSGGVIREHHLIAGLATLGRGTVVVLQVLSTTQRADLARSLGMDVISMPLKTVSKRRAVVAMLANPFLSWRIARIDLAELRPALSVLLQELRPHLVWLTSPAALECIVQDPSPRIFDLIDRPVTNTSEQLKAHIRRLVRGGAKFYHRPPFISRPGLFEVVKCVDDLVRAILFERRVHRMNALVLSSSASDLSRRPPSNHLVVTNGYELVEPDSTNAADLPDHYLLMPDNLN
jgi:hypothetical protein